MNNSGDSLNRSLTGLRERRDSEYNNEIFSNERRIGEGLR